LAWAFVLLAACGRIDFDAALPDGIPGLLVRYPMDDDPSTGHVHASVEAYDGTCRACPLATAGHADGGYAFDGTAFITLPAASTTLLGTMPYTVTVWVSPGTSTSQATVTEKAHAPGDQQNVFKLSILPGGIPSFETCSQVDGIDIFDPVNVDLRGSWHCLAEAWDGAMKRLYIDGAFVDSTAATLLDSSLPAQIGADLDNNVISDFYYGSIDDLRFYNRALDDSEIAKICQ
jgi:hypothetical protein